MSKNKLQIVSSSFYCLPLGHLQNRGGEMFIIQLTVCKNIKIYSLVAWP